MQEHCHLGKGLRERKGHTCPHQHSKNTESNELTTEFRGLEKNFWGDLGTPKIGRKHWENICCKWGYTTSYQGFTRDNFPCAPAFSKANSPSPA